MKLDCTVDVWDFKTIQRMDGFWTPQKYIDLLNLMDYSDTAAVAVEELEEMCLLALSDNRPEESAELVLSYVFGDALRIGQVKALADDIIDEKLWVEYADISKHEQFFNCGQLLYEAYGGTFPKPEAVSFKVRITSKATEIKAVGNDNIETDLIRLLAQGMPENALINRLFEKQLIEGNFAEAKDIIWHLSQSQIGLSKEFKIISSGYWFDDLKFTDSFRAVLQLYTDKV